MYQFVLRRAVKDDIADIRALTLRAYAKWIGVTPRLPRPMTADYNQAFIDHRFDILVEHAVLVGLVETVPQGEELMIVNVAVDPERQGEGHGFRLLRYAEEVARQAGLSGTRLYTNKLMTSNIELYTKLGYVIERETVHDAGTVAVHMTRSLKL
jgi:ribosomal protein S18 acetylase RimI-like enzyme